MDRCNGGGDVVVDWDGRTAGSECRGEAEMTATDSRVWGMVEGGSMQGYWNWKKSMSSSGIAAATVSTMGILAGTTGGFGGGATGGWGMT